MSADSTATLQPAGKGEYRLTGSLDFVSVPVLLRRGYDWLAGGSEVRVDLSGVAHCNSAALGLLLEWRRQARARKTSLLFRNIPASLLEIARVSEMQDFLAGA
jgi:phospholipid transport system transporter-binding protein